MQFDNEQLGNYTVVSVTGRLDAITASEFEAQCDIWLSQDEIEIVVEMSGVDYISSAGLRSILTSAKKLKARGGELRFCGLTGMVAEVFQMSGFAMMFKLFATKEQATS
ncbi:MAG: STAS domain-containing protein [Thermodesulfobacteriota bacterium]|nr:STAS domain-containing protein [Thermodesulfobacteriota bacterium]